MIISALACLLRLTKRVRMRKRRSGPQVRRVEIRPRRTRRGAVKLLISPNRIGPHWVHPGAG